MKKYIKPEVACVELDTDNLMLDTSNGTYAAPDAAVEVRRRGAHYFEEEEDFDF